MKQVVVRSSPLLPTLPLAHCAFHPSHPSDASRLPHLPHLSHAAHLHTHSLGVCHGHHPLWIALVHPLYNINHSNTLYHGWLEDVRANLVPRGPYRGLLQPCRRGNAEGILDSTPQRMVRTFPACGSSCRVGDEGWDREGHRWGQVKKGQGK